MGSIMALQGVKKLSEVPYKGCVTVDGFVQDLEFGAENDCKFWGLMTEATERKKLLRLG